MSDGYTHLLRGAAAGLPCFTCLEMNEMFVENAGTGSLLSVDRFIVDVESFFEDVGEAPFRVTYRLASETTYRRARYKTFARRFRGSELCVLRDFVSVSVSSSGVDNDPVSDTWLPRAAYIISSQGKIFNAFIQAPGDYFYLTNYFLNIATKKFEGIFNSGQIYQFPQKFSPTAYFFGISYDHSCKNLGSWLDRDRSRLTNWRNHCYRGLKPSGGFIRDVYPINIIYSDKFTDRVRVWENAMIDAGGHITTKGDLLKISTFDFEKLTNSQSLLEKKGILLSAIPC